MTKDRSIPKEDLFANLDGLRVTGDRLNGVNVDKLLTTIPVRRPGPQSFIRVHPSEDYRIDALLLTLQEERESYLVVPGLDLDLPGIRAERLLVYVDRSNNPMFWPIPLPGADGRDNQWHHSARIAAEKATTRWVRIAADRSLNGYKVFAAHGEIPEPKFPEEPLSDLLRVAFADRIITSVDHPVVKRLRGLGN